MEPGIHKLPFDKYRAIEAVNASSLKALATSPHHYQRQKQQPRQPSEAMVLGSATHTAVLESDQFLLEYALWRGKQRRGKEWEAFQVQHKGQTILRASSYAHCLQLRDAVRGHAPARKLLETPGRAEVSIVWDHSSGVRCKSRIDYLGNYSTLVDLKTTRDPSPRSFGRDAARLQYPLQLAFYADAVTAAIGCKPGLVAIIAVQNCEPFDVAVYHVPPEVLRLGRQQYEELLPKLEQCQQQQQWPGVAPEPLELELPAWAYPDPATELTIGGQPLAV